MEENAETGKSDQVKANVLSVVWNCLAGLFLPALLCTLALRRRTARLRLENELLRSLSIRDMLTGLANPEGLDTRLSAEFVQARRCRKPLSVVVVAIDHFETLADLGGTHRRDRYIVEVARALQSVVRKGVDLTARHGEQDFALILPGVDRHATFALAERLRRSVHGIKCSHRGSLRGDHLSISLGTATFEPGDTGSPALLMAKAEAAFRMARALGGNRVAA